MAHDQRAARADIEVTRSDEQLLVDTKWWPRRRVRVRKLIVTELRTMSVEVRRQEPCVETIDIDRSVVTTHPVDPGPLELVLHHEEIVVQRRVVPRERVRVDIDVVHEQVDGSDVIRHERIQVQQLPPTDKE